MLIMNRILIMLLSLILVIGHVYAQENIKDSDNKRVLQNDVAQAEEAVTGPSPGRTAPTPVQGTNVKRPERKTPPRTTRSNPSAPVTPGNVRDFFSKPKAENFIILNFDNAELKDVINTVSSITNENFILTPGIDARITIHSAKKIPISEVMNVFESVLEVNGIALVRSGDFFKVVQGASAKQKPTEVRKSDNVDDIPDMDRPVTQIIPVKYVPVSEVMTVLTPLLSPIGSMTPNARNNLLIINDLSSSLIRVMHILKEIDVDAFSNTRLYLFKPKYSDVLTLTTELTEVLNALNLTKEGIALVPIERINSLVVFSGSPTLLHTVIGWIKKLDEEVMSGQNIFVHPIQNVKAESIAEILGSLYETDVTPRRTPTTQKSQVPSTSKKTAPKRVTQARRKSATITGSSRVEIITFEPTNSLIILAPSGVYREMTELIKKIDVYPREVLIEAIIAEVDITSSDEYGIQWSALHSIDNGYKGLVQGNASAGTPPVTVLVRDQEEASIEVGSDIPTATSTTSSTAVSDALTQNIEYKTVGKKLKIKPSINDEKTVVLDIEQEVSDVLADARSVGGFSYPEFSTRKTKTSVVVPHKQGIVIGGIIEEKTTYAHEGIPILSRIPILGNLFRYTKRSLAKTELIIIIVPHVITNRSEGDKVTAEYLGKLKDIKSFLSEKEDQANVPFPEVLNATESDER